MPPAIELDLSPEERETKYAQLRNDYQYFINGVLGITNLWDGQKEIIQALSVKKKISVRSGHALGKDFVAACIILAFLYNHRPSIVIATAPTHRQIGKVIWGELAEKYYAAQIPLGGKLLTGANLLTVDEKLKWYALGFATQDTHATPGKFQGFHSPNVLLLFSEAQAIQPSIWAQAESLMTGENCKWLAIGNPLINHGDFYDTFQPKSQWHNITLDCEKNPNYIHRKTIVPGLASYDWCKGMEDKYGRDSDVFQSKVKGNFPKKSAGTFIEGDWIDTACFQNYDFIEAKGEKVAGVDVAGMGSDKTVITVRQGPKVIEVNKYEKRSTMETAGEVIVLIRDKGVSRVYLDVTGIGTGVYDRVVEEGYGKWVVPVNFGSRPSDEGYEHLKDTPEENNMPSRRFTNLITQMCYFFASLLEKKMITFPYDEDLKVQLINRKMVVQGSGKKRLEPKEDYTKRTGFGSPDEADSMVLAFSDLAIQYQSNEPLVVITDDKVLESIYS